MAIYDLHCHSTFSDGVLTPTELVKRAKKQGVDVLALSDHDTVDGLSEAQRQAETSDLTLIPSVEVSVSWQGRVIHIVALNVDAKNKNLLEGLQFNRNLRLLRAKKMATKLEKLGLDNVLERVSQYAGEAAITRTHFARLLVDSGFAATMNDVFKKYMVSGKPGFVKMQWVDMQTALKWIEEAGGIAVIAHPGRYKMTRSWLNRLIDDFINWGGKGIEVAYSTASKDEIKKFSDYAVRYDLYASCGSDFHDPKMHWLELGMHKTLPLAVKPVWTSEFFFNN